MKTRAGLPLGPLGELSSDLHLDDVLALPSVMWLLMPKGKTAVEKTVVKENDKVRQTDDKEDNPKKKKVKKA